MPVYEYQCDDCSNWTEVFCSVNDMPKSTECSTCKKTAFRRIKSVPAVCIDVKHRAVASNFEYHNVHPITGKKLRNRKK